MEEHLHKAIVSGLRRTLSDHGPITSEWIGSAAKRIVSAIIFKQIVLQPALFNRMNARLRVEKRRRRKAEIATKLLLNTLCAERSVEERWIIWKDVNRLARKIAHAEVHDTSAVEAKKFKSPSEVLEVFMLTYEDSLNAKG
jgi:hypothetical protein